MQIFADTADTTILRELASAGVLDGVTTNPSIIAKSGRNFLEVIKEICEICSGPVSAEVMAVHTEDMLAEGRKLHVIAENIVVKVPLTQQGLAATRIFKSEGIKTNVTLCFSLSQALLAAKAGATYISPFVGRLDDYGAAGLELITNIRTLYDTYNFQTQILAASVRNQTHVEAVALAGADCATMPPALITKLFDHPLTLKGLQDFAADWGATGQSIL